ncbi:pyruvate flavodoxin/ferredoxin oxidoreductase domain protein [Methanosalsum zhilinae DSM 4017]|uniref:2-oxoglutarate synthase subunit KorA n=1 Tax=Methanosalsum zhilinae (strain DSM 4017 / NBRC 107636 / OCM 62 / WeN5) TaxID=679901 RepID=F7XN11_METZD|nr:2-oxoacid:acceptor oxidoreductase subunit alpha [Methanosalsum zhilinae]AEH61120.1 pyruvate flavodoxin/ferredoxin oxidoreductase domain protein [Methanosalsum zhilinae DSM 4017]
MSVDLNIKIGGEAGQGLQTISSVLAKTLLRGGYNVFESQYFLSRIRGGHNYSEIRVSDEEILSKKENVDILIALDRSSIDQHIDELSDGVILIDKNEINIEDEISSIFHVPFSDIAEDVSGNKLYTNTVATGAALGLLCYDFEYLAEVLTDSFSSKGDEVVQKNIDAAKAGYDYSQENYSQKCHFSLQSIDNTSKKMLITGNEAIGLGAISAGLKFLSAYPMSPSTGALTYVAQKADQYNIIVEQAEDEIAALNMAIGASFAGTRSMVTTSGGGFSLMAEALGLAGITETPVVIYIGQRPGPATGLPTMTEQGDLEFVIHASQGEFPRCILAPATAEDAFYLTARAFNIADKYQIPVFILADQYLVDSSFTSKIFETSRISRDRHILSADEIESAGEYKRYKITDSGVSPRAVPGVTKELVMADSDEHNEIGHIDQTSENRIRMNNKRLRKMEGLKNEIYPPRIYGSKRPDLTFVGWGSTYGPLKESVDILNKNGAHVNLIHFNEVYPLPAKEIQNIFSDVEKCVCVENNATGQFARVLKIETGVEISDTILKYDGLPFTADYIINKVHERKMI